MIKRPFVIRQDVDNGKGEIVFELSHDNKMVSLDATHSLFPSMTFGVLLDKDTVEALEAAFAVLFAEMRDKHEYYVEQM